MFVVVAMLVGAIVPVQTAVNTRFRMSVGSPVAASFLSFIVAVVAATFLAGCVTGQFVPDVGRAMAEPWWIWLGGFMGVMFITGNIVLFPFLGTVETVILPILGQVIMGLVVDCLGLFGSPQVAVSGLRLLGAVTVVVGVTLVLEVLRMPAGRDITRASRPNGIRLWALRIFGVIMGVGSATQTAVNGRLGAVVGSPLQAGQISLAVGLVVLLVLALGLSASRRALATGVSPGPWWMWMGGVLGALFVFGGASLVPILGTGTTVIGSLTGTILCGQVLESLGVGMQRRAAPSLLRLVGLAFVLIGVVMVRLL